MDKKRNFVRCRSSCFVVFFLCWGRFFFSFVGRKKNNNIIDGRQAGLGLARHIAAAAIAATAAAATGSRSRPFLAGSCSVLA